MISAEPSGCLRRERHAGTRPRRHHRGRGSVTSSNSSEHTAAKAFDNADNAAAGRWLARQNQLPSFRPL